METGAMNCIVTFIRPFQLDAVVDELRHVHGFAGLSTSAVRGMGVSGAHPPRSPPSRRRERRWHAEVKRRG